MPNGGPDCCGNCSHNRAVQEMAHPHPEQRDRFFQLSRCTLREIKIANPFWTYCANFEYGKRPEGRDSTSTPIGWITASGLYEGYVRIPWNDDNEPLVAVPAECSICNRKTRQGIQVEHQGKPLGFCTNRHYVEWWGRCHESTAFDPNTYESPEARFARDEGARTSD